MIYISPFSHTRDFCTHMIGEVSARSPPLRSGGLGFITCGRIPPPTKKTRFHLRGIPSLFLFLHRPRTIHLRKSPAPILLSVPPPRNFFPLFVRRNAARHRLYRMLEVKGIFSQALSSKKGKEKKNQKLFRIKIGKEERKSYEELKKMMKWLTRVPCSFFLSTPFSLRVGHALKFYKTSRGVEINTKQIKMTGRGKGVDDPPLKGARSQFSLPPVSPSFLFYLEEMALSGVWYLLATDAITFVARSSSILPALISISSSRWWRQTRIFVPSSMMTRPTSLAAYG